MTFFEAKVKTDYSVDNDEAYGKILLDAERIIKADTINMMNNNQGDDDLINILYADGVNSYTFFDILMPWNDLVDIMTSVSTNNIYRCKS